jgi:hypothetical protein
VRNPSLDLPRDGHWSRTPGLPEVLFGAVFDKLCIMLNFNLSGITLVIETSPDF